MQEYMRCYSALTNLMLTNGGKHAILIGNPKIYGSVLSLIIDIHAHIFPEKIAEKAAESIGEFYHYDMHGDGRVETLLRYGDEAGVDKFVVHSVAMTPFRVEQVNTFIASSVQAHPDRFIGFMSLHPAMADPVDAIERAMDAGLMGVKLHPDMQRFETDSDMAMSMFEACAKYKLPVLLHAGDRRYHYSNPRQMLALKKRLPELTVIAAHYGGYSEWEESEALLPGEGIYVDCSSAFFGLSREKAVELTRKFGSEWVLFGSDFPMWHAKGELEKLRSLGLTEEEMENILHRNAERMLGL